MADEVKLVEADGTITWIYTYPDGHCEYVQKRPAK